LVIFQLSIQSVSPGAVREPLEHQDARAMNRRYFALLAVIGIVLIAFQELQAQRGRSIARRSAVGIGARTYGRWYANSYGGYSGTSAVGDARRGMAEVMRAQGENRKATAEAMFDYEEAKSKYIDNKKKWTETYLERKRMGEAARTEHYAKKRASIDKYRASRTSNTPARLTVSQIDPSTGRISWPSALQKAQFSASRKELDELFVLRAHTNSVVGLTDKIYAESRSMQASLKSKIKNIPATDYISARKFLDGLGNEGRYSPT